MSRKLIKACIVFSMFFICVFMVMFNVEAQDGDFNVVGKVYTFKDDEYKITKNKEYTSTNEDVNTYGKFAISGSIADVTEKDGISIFEVSKGNVSLSYTYGDSLLKAKETKWHLSSDDNEMVDSIEIDDEVGKGTIILQTSKDGKNWVDEVIKTNIFEEKPIETESFYTSNDIQLANGCYYRVIVAYETEIKRGEEKFLGIFSRDKYDYKNYAEVYEFYLINQDAQNEKVNNLKFSLGEKSKVDENGYTEESKIEKDDVHYGWDLGNFFVSGYTSSIVDSNGNNVFLKNAGDKVTLWFNLSQDINKLNKKDGLSIGNDNDGYDEYFETPRTDFGKGTLIVRYTDHENVKHKPTIYKNYLVANVSQGADTKVQLFEEGDYEVALDYVVKSDSSLLGFIPKSDDNHYRVFFKFSVRNGNCMTFPMDLKTNAELTNTAIAENGFYLDLAKSRYLDVNIKREVLNKGANGLVEDVRFNRPAKDGDKYTEEGIYTITVKNKYTNQTTEKVIYVGNNNVLKAHAVTGLSVKDIQGQVNNGVKINDDGTLEEVNSDYDPNDKKNTTNFGLILIPLIVLVAIGGGYFIVKQKQNKKIASSDNDMNLKVKDKGGEENEKANQ